MQILSQRFTYNIVNRFRFQQRNRFVRTGGLLTVRKFAALQTRQIKERTGIGSPHNHNVMSPQVLVREMPKGSNADII